MGSAYLLDSGTASAWLTMKKSTCCSRISCQVTVYLPVLARGEVNVVYFSSSFLYCVRSRRVAAVHQQAAQIGMLHRGKVKEVLDRWAGKKNDR